MPQDAAPVNPGQEPRPSASVILLDDGPGADQPFSILLLERAGGMSFMPGRFVFPGGSVEAADGDDPLDQGTLKRAALRELWEEAGVVLARTKGGGGLDTAKARELGRGLSAGELGLDEALKELGAEADLEALRPHARWITPLARGKRFDTLFFLARLPQGQEAAPGDAESTRAVWRGANRALADNGAGTLSLAPPQVSLMGRLAAFGSLPELLGSTPNLSPVLPVLWSDGQNRIILFPWDPEYSSGAPSDPDNPGSPCPAGKAGRLLFRENRWLPLSAV